MIFIACCSAFFGGGAQGLVYLGGNDGGDEPYMAMLLALYSGTTFGRTWEIIYSAGDKPGSIIQKANTHFTPVLYTCQLLCSLNILSQVSEFHSFYTGLGENCIASHLSVSVLFPFTSSAKVLGE